MHNIWSYDKYWGGDRRSGMRDGEEKGFFFSADKGADQNGTRASVRYTQIGLHAGNIFFFKLLTVRK